jgi:hypothetical protein
MRAFLTLERLLKEYLKKSCLFPEMVQSRDMKKKLSSYVKAKDKAKRRLIKQLEKHIDYSPAWVISPLKPKL